ncbi:dTDP-4-dehydrorhamnose reductase [Paenibacillus dendritiformis]|uniref:dTDP-4-dehydrorhamnose reductase n=1 Tax=Paenibacillus dendritiformis TaxID=130049 RepID=UPI0020C3D146|nr:dTDP-4-dehydrorhamnose reductase [Paenibacillus dendritiformis]CAH8773269.1 dTDP-4-dehydrorhamnose reductase [Paenibacillus dendritiformis]
MKILVTGANGQLGTDVVRLFSAYGYDVIGCGRDDLDITNENQCLQKIQSYQPEAIIHCAAYTAVDQAEANPDEAYRVNAMGTRNIAIAAEQVGAKLCYISTDYVFSGNDCEPYVEYDNTNPVNVYGKSKRAGELLVQSLTSKYFIVRTSWVFGSEGNNFVKTMLRLGQERQELSVVHDQWGSPTYTRDLAQFLGALIKTKRYGIYHASNHGACSWYEFAKEIFAAKNLNVNVVPCTTEQFPRLALRPKYSVLEPMAIRTNGFAPFRHWKEALHDFLGTIG